MSTRDHLTARYRWLVEQLGNDVGRARGWRKRVAEQLGIHPSYVTKLLSGASDEVGIDVVERAIERLGLNRALFFDPQLDIADVESWREFQLVLGPDPRQKLVSPEAAAAGATYAPKALHPDSTERHWRSVRLLAKAIRRAGAAGEGVDVDDGIALARAVFDLPPVLTAVRILGAHHAGETVKPEQVMRLTMELEELDEAVEQDTKRDRQRVEAARRAADPERESR